MFSSEEIDRAHAHQDGLLAEAHEALEESERLLREHDGNVAAATQNVVTRFLSGLKASSAYG